MSYFSIAFADGTGYVLDGSEMLMKDNHIEILDENGWIRDIIPYANLKVASVITEEEYVASLENQENEDDG